MVISKGLRTNNKFNAIYGFTSTVFNPGIPSLCCEGACSHSRAIPPSLFYHQIRH